MKKEKLPKNLLGELETEIMETIWELEKASVREVLACLKKKRKIAYTTVMTVMSRLYAKKILKRDFNSTGAYLYQAVHKDKQDFLASFSQRAINNIMKSFGEELAVSQFLDFIEGKDLKTIKKWQKKLKNIK